MEARKLEKDHGGGKRKMLREGKQENTSHLNWKGEWLCGGEGSVQMGEQRKAEGKEK